MALTNSGNSLGKQAGDWAARFSSRGQGGALAASLSANNFRQEIEDMIEEERFFNYLGAVKGSLWAILISVYLWLISGILVLSLLR